MLDLLDVHLVVAGEALAVVAVIRERHEALEVLHEALAAGPAVVGELVVFFRLRLHVHQFVVAASESNLVAGVDGGDLALGVEGGGRGLELAVARMVRFHQFGG